MTHKKNAMACGGDALLAVRLVMPSELPLVCKLAELLASGGVEWAVEHPQYALHALDGTPGAFDDVKQWLGEDVLGYYAILSSGGTVQPYRIYFSRDGRYWITSFTDNTADGSVILYDIYAMEKAE